MNFGNYTQKSMEAFQRAQSLAQENSNQQLEQVHLLLALLQQEGGLIPQLLRKMEVTVESLEAAVKAEVQKLPTVTGSREADRFYISGAVDATFRSAQEQAGTMQDAFVSVEHLFLALVDTAKDAAGNTSSAAVTLVILERRITREELMAKIGALATALEITAELDTEEKCRLIYGYVNSPTASASNATVVFTDESNTDRTDWIREAYLTLERGAGDCYSYFALSKAFFEYFGIENRDIERAKGVTTQSGTHFWSLVNVGTKSAPEWYYFDATRLASKHKTGSGCLFTESQLIDYNTKVKVGFLTYDHTGYPKASEKTINEGYTW